MNMSDAADWEYGNSRVFTEELTEMTFAQKNIIKMEETAKIFEKIKTIAYSNANRRNKIYSQLQPHEQRIIDLASEKSASSWLTSLPLAECGFVLNKQEFHYAIF